jgi:hypothetical protein
MELAAVRNLCGIKAPMPEIAFMVPQAPSPALRHCAMHQRGLTQRLGFLMAASMCGTRTTI